MKYNRSCRSTAINRRCPHPPVQFRYTINSRTITSSLLPLLLPLLQCDFTIPSRRRPTSFTLSPSPTSCQLTQLNAKTSTLVTLTSQRHPLATLGTVTKQSLITSTSSPTMSLQAVTFPLHQQPRAHDFITATPTNASISPRRRPAHLAGHDVIVTSSRHFWPYKYCMASKYGRFSRHYMHVRVYRSFETFE